MGFRIQSVKNVTLDETYERNKEISHNEKGKGGILYFDDVAKFSKLWIIENRWSWMFSHRRFLCYANEHKAATEMHCHSEDKISIS